jgi:hypothetical protein
MKVGDLVNWQSSETQKPIIGVVIATLEDGWLEVFWPAWDDTAMMKADWMGLIHEGR